MLRIKLLGIALILSVLNVSGAHALGIEIAAGGWRQDPGGDLSYEAEGAGDVLSVEDDLSYDAENRLHGRLKIDMPLFLPNVALIAAPTEFSSTGQKSGDFTFGNETFEGSTPFHSSLTFDQYDLTLYYGLPFIQTATLKKLNIEVGVNVRWVDLEARIRQDTTGIEESHDATLAIPQLYFAAQLLPVEWLSIEGEGRGIAIGGDAFYSLIGRMRFNVLGPAFIAAGYRYDAIDMDVDDFEGDFTIQGPFAEAGIKF